ncbi:MAG: protein kinase [Spirochaetaceae bacterium]|nr:protein kinase [Myxococcales bacterium]MCB9724209.1 protein kinase [Spirochaetaceae bacterium]HPG24975.1 serine/threonine-protein kinase [Myxococcota bacterium]
MSGKLRRGSRIGKYRLEQKLGEGGSAVVWKARDTIEGRRVALKILQPAVVSQHGREAIEVEARLAAQLDHPRIASIRNADWIDGHFVIVTDLALASLDRYPRARRSPMTALRIVGDVAEGLAYAHDQGLLHRDIKPANIFVYEGGRARLGDFGTARLAPATTRLLTEVGTFGYMAPEQAYGRTRFASDVFSLALTAYELFAGVLPGWPFEWPLEGAARFARRCPAPLQPVIRKGLELDLRRRFTDAIQFHEAFAKAAARVHADAARGSERAATRRRRRLAPALPPDPFSLEMGWFRRRYGKVLEAVYDCHACDGPIAESMSHCPWCGTTRNSFAEVTRFPLVCPDCERGVRPEWSACPTCSRGRFESNGRKIPGAATAERTCRKPGCGAPIHRFMRYCPACKTKIDRPWRVEGLPPCARCRWPFVSRWRFCAWCGRKNTRAMDVTAVRRSERPR